MKKLLSVFLLAILLVGCSAPKETASYRQISMDEAITMMEEGPDRRARVQALRAGKTLSLPTAAARPREGPAGPSPRPQGPGEMLVQIQNLRPGITGSDCRPCPMLQ